MTSTEGELSERLAKIRPVDTVRGYTLNSLFRLVEAELGRGAAEALRTEKVGRRPVDFLSYPATDFLHVLFGISDLLARRFGTREAVFREAGAIGVRGFFESLVGRTLLSIAGHQDPRRFFSLVPSAYQTSVSYGERRVEQLEGNELRIVFLGDMMPVPFHVGVLEVALQVCGNPGTVQGRAHSLTESEYLIRWELAPRASY